MSFDDGSLGKRGDRTDSRGRGTQGLLTDIITRLRTHLREWPARYVEMRTHLYEE